MEGGDLRMSNTIDTRVVEMKFDRSDFARGVSATIKDLDNLKKATKLDGATKGLDELNAKASHINLSGISNGLSTLTSKFSAMGVIGVAALASIATKGIQVGAQLVNSLALGPLKAGLEEYETNLNSIQTILANTGLEGKSGLAQVNKALGDLNHYSDQTIYNFSEMARNIGTFTAAGIKLEPATAAIKGIANLAAISGSNAEQASSAMYQLSQAMAAGKATLVDWNSVVNAGMGGKVFQDALVETARVQGQNIDAIIKKNGSFRDSLQEGWLTTKVLTETLQKFTGDLSKEQLKSMGYNDKQIAGIIKMGKTAQDAATKVKTMSQLIGTLQEAAGSGWAQTWQLLFGDFEEARTLFTNVSNVLGGFIQKSSQARNKVLGDWKALGGRTVLINAISIAFANLMDVLSPIGKAFRDIFPATTGKQLYNLTVQFRDLMASMRLGEDTMDNIRRTFRGLFAAVDIGIQILKGIGTILLTVFKSFSGGSGGILEFTGNIGDWLVALDKAIKKGKGFQNFFKNIGETIAGAVQFLKSFIGSIVDIAKNLGHLDLSGVGDILQKRFAPLGKMGGVISKTWGKMVDIFKNVLKAFEPLTDKFSEFFSSFGDTVSESFNNLDYNGILDGINTGLLAGLVLLFKKFLSGGIDVNLGGGVLETIKESFEGLTKVMGAMQAQLKAQALIKIAGAIALLTASVVALSLIDSKKLTSALTAMTIMFTQLLGAMAIFEKISASKGFLKMPALTAALIGLAIAIDLLAVAVAILANLDWNGIAKGLTGVATLLASLALYSKFSAANAAGISSSAGIVLLAGGIKLLVSSVKDFAGMNWSDIAKGLVGVAGLLGSLALFTKLAAADKGGIAQGAGLVLLAGAIKILASAMNDLGQLSWTEIAKGLVAMAGALALMGAALVLIPPTSVLSAAAIFIVAKSLGDIGKALEIMGGMGWGEIAKGLVTLAGALTIITLAMIFMTEALPGAAALLVVAASLRVMTPALQAFGEMSWGEIAKAMTVLAASLLLITAAMIGMTTALPGAAALVVVASALRILAPVLLQFGEMSWGSIAKGLVMLAGAFAVIGIAGLVLTPLIPSLIGLGVAISLLGAGAALAGVGVFLFAAGFTALAASGAAGAAVIIGIVKSLLGLLPMVVTQVGAIVLAFAKVIQTAGPAIVKAITVVLLSLLDAITRLAPKIASTFNVLVASLLKILVTNIPKMVDAGAKILLGVLKGISAHIGEIVKVVADIIVKFLNALSAAMPRVLQAGADFIISFINNLASTIRNNTAALQSAGANLAGAIIDGMTGGLASGAGKIASKAKEVASSALNAAKNVLGIHSPSKEFFKIGRFTNEGFALGIDQYKKVVVKSAEAVGTESIEALRSSMSGISDILLTDSNFTPIVRPVLDLTGVQKDAAQIGAMLATKPLQLATTAAKAKDASAGYSANQQAKQDSHISASDNIEFTQINNSPKALSNAEIYRQTNNQLSRVKGALSKD